MDHDRIFDSLTPWALGESTPEQKVEIQNHLDSGCQACARELREISETIHLLALSLQPQLPPGSMKLRLMSSITPKHGVAHG